MLRRRIVGQHLRTDPCASAAEVVADLVCVQSQEYSHAFWSLGLRCLAPTFAEIRRQFDDGQFLRTHILRPTWHFVTPADIRAVLAVTSPRVHRRNAGRYRELGLDAGTLSRSVEVIAAALVGNHYRTRRELGQELERRGISTAGQRLAHLVMYAELEALICSGPMAGPQHTYALLDERVPPAPQTDPKDALAELVFRFFSGHGPASVAELVRWSSLPTAEVKAAVESLRDRLESSTAEGQTLWWDPQRPLPPSGPSRPVALLLPLYDELLLSYRALNFPRDPRHPHAPRDDLFVGSVIVDGPMGARNTGPRNVGTWRRTVRGSFVQVQTSLSPSVTRAEEKAVQEAVRELAAFLQLELQVVDATH